MSIMIEEYMHYGTRRFYPKNELARQYADLLGTTTLTSGALKFIEGLGVSIQLEHKSWG